MSNFSQTPFFRHILAMDTSTDQLSLAVATTHGSVDAATWDVWAFSGESGAKASAGMVAAIQALLADAGIALSQVDAIAFGQGPGAFTGLRTACAVTQGLAASLRPGGVPVIPVNTLLAVAQAARLAAAARGDVSATALAGPWTAVMDARMGEVYVARYVFTSALTPTAVPACTQAPVLLAPTALKAWVADRERGHVVGNAYAAYGAQWVDAPGFEVWQDAMPTAAALLHLSPALWASGAAVAASDAVPLYVRDKVAQTTAERLHLKAVQAAKDPLQP